MNSTDVKAKILASATRFFAHRGYGSTSIREVVEAAGVTKPTLYYYFSSKEGLFVDAVNCQSGWFIAQLECALRAPGTATDRLRVFLDRYLGGVVENEDGARLLMTVKMPGEPGSDEQPAVDLMKLHRRTMEIVSELLEDGIGEGVLRADIDVNDAALALVGAAHMRLLAFLHGQGLVEDYVDRLMNTFVQGVKA